jgi:lysophospholipase L1-like esterase
VGDAPQDFPNVEVINRGFGGSQLDEVTAFAERIVVPYHPKIIVLYCGDNDIASGKKSPQDVLAEFKAFVTTVRSGLSRTPIAFISMKPAPSTWTKYGKLMRSGNQLIQDYIKSDPSLAYIDVFTPMLNAQGTPRSELFGPDNEHMNAAGYALWTLTVKPFLK